MRLVPTYGVFVSTADFSGKKPANQALRAMSYNRVDLELFRITQDGKTIFVYFDPDDITAPRVGERVRVTGRNVQQSGSGSTVRWLLADRVEGQEG